MKTIEVKRPNCSTALKTKNDKSVIYCEHCGYKILLGEDVLSLIADEDAKNDIAYHSKLNNKQDRQPAELYTETRCTLC